jgi:MFS family permease
MIGLVWVFVLLVVPTFLSGWIAERHGRSTILWYWLGAIFGPIAPLVVALLPPASEPGSHPPWSALRRRTHGRVSGGRGESHSRAIVVCATP